MCVSGYRLQLGPERKFLFLQQLSADVELLKSLHIMDYSLLLGVHRMSDDEMETDDVRIRHHIAVLDAQGAAAKARRAAELGLTPVPSKPRPSEEDAPLRMPMPTGAPPSGVRSEEPDGTPGALSYHFGIIDILQRFNVKKQTESIFKRLLLGRQGDTISAVDPATYASRFLRFLGENTGSVQ